MGSSNYGRTICPVWVIKIKRRLAITEIDRACENLSRIPVCMIQLALSCLGPIDKSPLGILGSESDSNIS